MVYTDLFPTNQFDYPEVVTHLLRKGILSPGVSSSKIFTREKRSDFIEPHEDSVGTLFPRFGGLISSSDCFDAIIKI
jgi:hypothetical protein